MSYTPIVASIALDLLCFDIAPVLMKHVDESASQLTRKQWHGLETKRRSFPSATRFDSHTSQGSGIVWGSGIAGASRSATTTAAAATGGGRAGGVQWGLGANRGGPVLGSGMAADAPSTETAFGARLFGGPGASAGFGASSSGFGATGFSASSPLGASVAAAALGWGAGGSDGLLSAVGSGQSSSAAGTSATVGEVDLEAFKATRFVRGKIPDTPPPEELCF